MLPNLIIIGAMKCGTTSLHHYLSQHPQVQMSCPKELRYFFDDGNWRKGLAWYESHFHGPADIHGEASPGYTSFPQRVGVPQRMHALVPQARLIYVVRHPIERMVSHYLHQYAESMEHRPIEQALGGPDLGQYLSESRYRDQLEQYLSFYRPEQILLLTQEELLHQRLETLRRIFRFLGIDDSFRCDAFDAVLHRTEEKRRRNRLGRWVSNSAAGKLAGALAFRALGWKMAHNFVPSPAERAVFRPFSSPVARPTISQATRRRLADALRDDVARLEGFAGRRFGWDL